MRALVGIIVVQCALVAAGLGVLRVLGLVVSRGGRAWLAIGPAFVVGTASVIVLLIALEVIGVPLTFGTAVVVAVLVAAAGFGLTWRRTEAEDAGVAVLGMATLSRVAIGAYALARAPTRGDDARIWSLKGLALTYHDSLRPEIFLNPAAVASHPVYPIFQPVLEAVLGRAAGQPALRVIHAELWLLLIAAIWTVGYVIWWRCARPLREQVGIALLAMLAILPAVVSNIWSGYADATGAVLLATGAVSLGLWIDRREPGHLWLAAILLAAAANTKDEDMVGAVLVLLAAGVALAVRADGRRLRLWLSAAGLFVVLIAPWRIWTAAHHLSDSVVPPLPRALSPVFVLDRLPQLKQTAFAMVTQTLSGWGWLAAIFIALCILSLVTRTGRRLAAFYLLSFALLVAALVWLYTTTSVSLTFLIPTSMARAITVFMALTPVASAHLLTKLLAAPAEDLPPEAEAARKHTDTGVLGSSRS